MIWWCTNLYRYNGGPPYLIDVLVILWRTPLVILCPSPPDLTMFNPISFWELSPIIVPPPSSVNFTPSDSCETLPASFLWLHSVLHYYADPSIPFISSSILCPLVVSTWYPADNHSSYPIFPIPVVSRSVPWFLFHTCSQTCRCWVSVYHTSPPPSWSGSPFHFHISYCNTGFFNHL